MALQLFNKFKILTFYHHLNIKWFSERYIASLIWLVMLLSVPLSASAAQVSVLASTSQIATGAGLTGTPSLNNFTIPAGKNRQVLVIAGFERDHCDQASDVCNLTYVAGTGGLSDNFARPVSSVYQITARISGSGGTIDKKNALTIGGTPSGDLCFSFQENNLVDANAVQIPNSTLFSTESYHIALNETEINTLLGGSPSGTVSISLPDVLQPKSAGDDAILTAFVFSNVEQTDSGIVRSAVPQLVKSTTTIPGNYTLTASAFDPGQAPDDINDGLLVVGFSTIGQPSSLGGFLTMSGYTQLQSTVTNNSNGIYDNSEPQWTTVEPDGLSMSAQFHNGVASAFTLQSNADSSLSAWGGWAPAFTISSDNADTSDAPASYGTSTHTISGIRLGATVDADTSLLSSSDATGDDTNGSDDENGVTLPALFTAASTSSISVNVQNASGYLNAWFDWNQDGDFLDAGEQVLTDQTVTIGTNNFNISVPATATNGSTFARFRVCNSTAQCKVSSGVAPTGEVEDYAVPVKGYKSLSGIVFEDINYGGGNGRSLALSGGKGVNGTKVELYNSTGSLVSTTTTANNGTNDGAYSFIGLASGDYYVRVVNSTVRSTRSGNNGTERGVQTYRTDGTTDVTNEIGGRAPNLADAGANTGSETLNTSTFSLSSSGTVQSVQPVTVTNLNISGVMFGFNFDTIVNTNDSGQGSLRQFILNSNLLGNAGLAQSGLTAGLETSIFQIPGTGPFTISPSSALPAITDSYTAINGSTQSGSSCTASARTLMIALSGTSAGATVSGLTVNGANALVKGLAIGNFTDVGVSANSAGSNLTVKCSNIGLNTDGTTAMQNGTFGIYDNAGGNLTIGGTSVDDRNIISNNFKDGIKLNSVVTALIQNNYVGTSADGLTAKSNNQEAADQAGILLTGTSAVPSKTITVTGNVIAGNNKANTAVNANNTTKGIRLSYANFVTITNNKIGTTPDGMTALANTGYGIYTINSTDITIGGTTAADRNIISGNGQDGINTRSGTNRISILGNYIGLGSDGVKALGNANNGIFLADTSNATIGNSSTSGRNIIGSNSYSGIRNSTSTGTKITDNYVGTDVSGTLDRGNTLHGVYVNNANDVVVGGSNAADGNLVVYNKVIGVFTDKTATNNTNTLIENNYVGMLKDGETIAGNTQAGVETKNNVGVTIRNNLISGNKTRGIHLVNSPSTTITNNRIGTNANGTSDKGNLNHGIDVETAAATLLVNNNVISGNDQSGIRLINGDATGTIITNNRIGTNQDGSSAIANTLDGITIDNVPNFTIGSTTTTGNTISGNNRHGIVIANASTKNLTVVGNLIGLNSAGTAALANANQGIMVQNGATAIKIGDGSAAGSNKIAYNGDNGIILSGTSTNDVSISQNSIYANTTLGIDINLDKVTINDANDSDTGPNAVLNFPLIKSANLNSGNLTLSGCAPTGAILEFFEADVSPTSSSGVSAGANKTTLTQDYGEGEQFIARFTEGVGEDTQSPPLDCASLVGADGNSAVGMSPFQWTITTPSTLVSGDKVTATATVTGTGTSEFSGVASALNPIDYADAPASYGTPSHNIVSGVQLGLNIDADSGAFATTDATGDDLDSSDDEDAIITMPSFMQGSTASVTVKATGAGGYLQAWSDWNQDGQFDDGEQFLTNVQDGGAFDTDNTVNGSISFYITVPDTAKVGSTILRLRWSTIVDLNATSAASNGEVEDYQITVNALTDGMCSGYSAVVYNPNTSNSETNYDGWSNGYDKNALGTFPYKVFENTPQWISISGMDWKYGATITDGVGDDAGYVGYKLTDADWDRSIAFTHIMAPGEGGNYRFTLTWGDDHVKIFKNDVQVAALQNAYNSTPGEAPYVVLDNYPLAVGDKLTIVVTEEHNYNTAVKLQVTPLFPSPCAPHDYGDAPASYEPTTKAFHVINSDMYLGNSSPDSETAPSAPLDGTGDDVTGSDDDDGLTMPTLQQGKRVEFNVKAHGANGYLQGWIDWNGDGDFDDTVGGRAERIALNYQDGVLISTHGSHGDLDQSANGTIRFQVLPPTNATTSPTYLRLRWSSTKDLDTTSPAIDGEVEDYPISIQANTFPGYGTGTQAACSASNQRQLLLDPELDAVNGSGGWTNWTVTSNPSNPSYPWLSNQRTGYASVWLDTGNTTLSQTNLSGWNRGPSSYGGAKLQLDLFWADASNGTLGTDSLSRAVTLEVRVGTTVYATLTTSPGYDFSQEGVITYYNGATGNLTSMPTKGESVNVRGSATPSTSWFIELPNTAPATGDFNLRLDADPAAASNGDDILVASASAWVCNEDYSDAPSTYGAPSHFISNTTYLGASAPDAEAGASPSVNADEDDLTGTDDEEGITLPSMTQRQNVLVTAKVAGTGGYLQGWIDWDGSGTFEANEQVAPNLQDNGAGDLDSTTGTIQFSVSVPSYAVTTKTYARFRWSTVANLDATSAASNGEVEDYALTIARSALCSTIEDKEALFLHDDNGKRIFRIDNVATTPVLDSTPVMSTVAGSAGLTISHNLNGGTPSPTFYVVAGGRYYWFNDSTWVNTSHSVTSYDVAPNPGGGVNYIFSYNGTDVWRYDGTSTPSTPLVTGINASMASYYDVATDAQDNFYIVKSTAGKILKYSKDGALLATYTAIGMPTGLQPGYAMIGNDMYVFANGGGIYRGVQNNDVVNFSKIATISISGVTINDIAACPSASIGFQTPKYNLSGVVFEDINYGGGAGRDFTTAAGKGVNGATVELYKADGTYVGNTTTANDGTQDGVYTFNQVLDGTYYVRVVNDTVNSTRVGSNGTELGVQTFRTDGTTAVTNEVGGHNPSLADGAANTGTETLNTTTYQLSGGANVQSLQAVTLAGADLSGIEFGFNFDTIVNTKANEQGSFAQFLANSNLLKNDNLDQADTLIAIPAGQETTIFMIPTTDTGFVNSPDGGTGKAWLIATGTQYLTMTDANTAVDGSTQTASMGNTNAAVSDITLGSEIIISNSGTPNNSNYGALTIRDTVGFVRNIGITTSSNIAGVTVYQADMTKTLTSGSEITQVTSFNIGNSGITLEGAKGVKVENNISRAAGKVNTISDGLIFVNGANQNTVRNNIFHSNSSCGIDVLPTIKNSNNLIESNQIYNNGYGSTSSQEAGICIRSGDGNTIRNNTIYKNKNDGITVMSGNQSNVFTQNAIYQNGNIGIDLGTGSSSLGDGITVNDANDADTGGNNLLNFPMIKQALSVNGQLVIQGCAPSGSTIELYEADVSPTSVSQVAAGSNKFGKTQDYGEGERYLTTFVEGAGEDTVTTPVDCATLTDADGNSAVGMSPFQWTLTMPSNVLIDDKLTVTATNASNTSEFSPVVSLQLYQDRGDASASYGDATHTINAAVYLGTTLPDMDASSVASTGADGDDISGIDDEDSVSILPSLYTSSTGTSVNVKVLNSTGNKAWLVGWIDFNKNGVFDSNEAATIPVSSAAQAKTVGLTWANLSGLTAGDTHMRLRLTTDPLIATGVASTSQATGTATDGEVEDYVVTIQQDGAVLTGKVFNDANVNGINDTEAGIDNVTVVLKDDSANTCRSVQTQADGSYQFAGLAAGSYTVYEAANANVPVPDTCPPVTADPTGYSSSTANSKTLSIAANATVQQDFGDVASPSFTLDNSLVTQPNTTVVHPHMFRTEVNGEVSLSLIDENLDPSNLLWESQLLRDANCDSKLNAGDTVITGAISLNAGDKLCILTKVLTPANASSGATQTLTLQSEFTYGDGSVLTATNKQTRTDTTKVNAASSDTAVSGAGKLDLKKFVWNVTRNQSGETALPGETLRYTIQYENIGDGVLDELVVHDALPSFTDLVAGSPTCVQTPTELSLCTPHVVDNAIDWSFVGKLQAGNHGSVSYEVVIH